MNSSPDIISVALADDHQPVLAGYNAELKQDPNIHVVGQAYNEEELRQLLAREEVDVLILDVGLPISSSNRNSFPILFTIPKLLYHYPRLHLLIISMHDSPPLIRALADANISGYIVKDDVQSLENLTHAVRLIAHDGTYFSRVALEALRSKTPTPEQAPLPRRQAEVLSLVMAYPDENAIALGRRMGITATAVRSHLHQIYRQLGVHTRAGAVAKARELGLITPFPEQPPL